MRLARKVGVLSIFVVFFSVVAIYSVGEPTLYEKNDYLRFINSDVGAAIAYTEYEICNPTPTDITTIKKELNQFDWEFIKYKGDLKEIWFEHQVNYLCEKIDSYKETCEEDTLSLNGSVIKGECTSTPIYHDSVCTQWKRFSPEKYTYRGEKCERIRIYGTYEPALGKANEIVIDNVLSFAGYKYDEYAFWNASFNFKQNISDASGDTYVSNWVNVSMNTSDYIAAAMMNRDCSDLRVVNCTNDEIPRKVINCNRPDTEIWFNYTSGCGDPQIYYGFAGAGPQPDRNLSDWIVAGSSTFDEFTNAYDISLESLWSDDGTDITHTDQAEFYSGSLEPTENQSLKVSDAAGDNTLILDWTESITQGILQYKIMFAAGVNDPYVMLFRSGAADEILILHMENADNTLSYYDSFGLKTLDGVVNNIWYTVRIEFDGTDLIELFNISLMNNTGSATITHNVMTMRDGGSQAGIDARAWAMNTAADTWYFDDIMLWETSIYTNPPFVFEAQELGPVGAITLVLNTPTNTTYGTDTVTIDGTTDTDGNMSYSMDLGTNKTLDNKTQTFTNTSEVLSEGSHNIWVYAEKFNNAAIVDDSRVFFLLDLSPPTITIEEPTDSFYTENASIPLNYNVTDKYSLIAECWYSIDNAVTNTTIANCLNTTITPTEAGTHNVILYTNDTMGWENSSTATFYYYPYNEFHANDSVSGAIISDFQIQIPEISRIFTTANGTIHIPLNVTGYGARTFRFISPAFNTTEYFFTLDNTSRINTTAFMFPSSLSVTVYDETDAALNLWTNLTFNITAYNSTFSQTWYNQSTFFEYTNSTPTGDVTIDISSTGYQTRRYYEFINANSANSFTAFLLATADALFVRFHIRTITEQPIQGATVQAQRFLNNTWTIIAEQLSDVAGTSAMHLNPYSTYRINVTAGGYMSQLITLQPSNTDYRIYMQATGAGATLEAPATNVSMYFMPSILSVNNSLQEFVCQVTSVDSNLEYVGFNLTHYNGTVWYNNKTVTTTGIMLNTSVDLTFENGTNLTAMCYFKRIGQVEYVSNKTYHVYNYTFSGGSLASGLSALGSSGFSDLALGLISTVITAVVAGAVGRMGNNVVAGAVAGMVVLGIFTFYLGWFDWLVYMLIAVVLTSFAFLRGGI